jgi:hypothetical protein
VHRPVGEQGEDGGANIAAARPWASAATATAGAEAGSAESATAGELFAIASGMT